VYIKGKAGGGGQESRKYDLYYGKLKVNVFSDQESFKGEREERFLRRVRLFRSRVLGRRGKGSVLFQFPSLLSTRKGQSLFQGKSIFLRKREKGTGGKGTERF